MLLITKVLCHFFLPGYPVFQINVGGPENIGETEDIWFLYLEYWTKTSSPSLHGFFPTR